MDRHVGRWTVDKVDLTTHDSVKETRQKERETKAQKAELKRNMKFLFDKKVMPNLIEKYAEKDEELAELLKQYNEL